MKNLLVLCFFMLLFSCKKEKDTPATPPSLFGEWYGMYGNTLTQIPASPYYFNIRSNNTMRISGYDTSTWIFADTNYVLSQTDSLKCTYTYRSKAGTTLGTYSIALRYLPNFSFISGTWGYGKNAYNGGYFYMGRKQP